MIDWRIRDYQNCSVLCCVPQLYTSHKHTQMSSANTGVLDLFRFSLSKGFLSVLCVILT